MRRLPVIDHIAGAFSGLILGFIQRPLSAIVRFVIAGALGVVTLTTGTLAYTTICQNWNICPRAIAIWSLGSSCRRQAIISIP